MYLKKLINYPREIIRKLYSWMLKWSAKKQAERVLSGIAFSESSFFPIPPDPLLLAMTIANPKKWKRFALICTISSVFGALLGYIIGVALFESAGRFIIDTYHLQEAFVSLGTRYQENAFLTIFTAAFTPIPYKIITIAAGVFKVNIFSLIIASLIGRGARFSLVSFLGQKFGAKYQEKITKYIDIFSLVFVALIALGFVLTKFAL
jgi:membrane protein YqaA with SNARE-associated domain